MRTVKSTLGTFTLTAALMLLPAIAAFAKDKLSLGDRGAAVVQLQELLRDKGKYSGKIDGKFGEKTAEAVMDFQRSKGLKKIDGIVGEQTWALLTVDKVPNPTIKLNDKGEAVRKLQKALKIGVDGKFGKKTDEAVRKFQSKNSLPVDGVVGASTWAALGDP